MSKVKPIPDGYHTVTPYLSVKEASKAIQFYEKAFGATVIEVCDGPGGKIMHAVLKIGNSYIMLSDESPECDSGVSSPQSLKGVSSMIFLYVEDADVTFNQAVRAGAKVKMPISDMFWGDRYGQIEDPFGHIWSIATHKVDMTKEEVSKAAEALFSKSTECC